MMEREDSKLTREVGSGRNGFPRSIDVSSKGETEYVHDCSTQRRTERLNPLKVVADLLLYVPMIIIDLEYGVFRE